MNNKQLEQLFLNLTDYTYIYGYEDEVYEKYLPKNLKKDSFGNYFIKIGESKTIFTCHLDTVGKQKLKVNHVIYEKDGHKFVKTDGNTILGGDDKAGVVILLNMIENNIPGLYLFLIGEEKGTVGSNLLVRNMSDMLSKYDRCIGFDRHAYGSIINRQMGKNCCSSHFAEQLSQEFAKNGMNYKSDPYGVWTDTALFMGIVPECTNISVGYFNEHTTEEEQDLDYLIQLAQVAIKIDWENLITSRTKEHFDTEDPKEDYKITDLPLYKLHKIFDEVEDTIYDINRTFASNRNFFKPEKEMTFFSVKDLDGLKNFSVYIHSDGSITLKKKDVVLNFKNLQIFKRLSESKRLKKLLRFNQSITINE